MREAVDSLARDVPSTAALCLLVLGGPAGPTELSPDVIHALTTRRPVVGLADCPPTYDRMISLADAAGRSLDPPRPPGYVDPVQLTHGRPQFDRPGYALRRRDTSDVSVSSLQRRDVRLRLSARHPPTTVSMLPSLSPPLVRRLLWVDCGAGLLVGRA